MHLRHFSKELKQYSVQEKERIDYQTSCDIASCRKEEKKGQARKYLDELNSWNDGRNDTQED